MTISSFSKMVTRWFRHCKEDGLKMI